MTLSATKVLWRTPALMLANAWVMLPVGIALSSCLFGLPIVARALRGLALHALANARELSGGDPPNPRRKSVAGWLALPGLFVAGAVMLAGGGLAAHLFEGASLTLVLPARLLGGSLAIVVVSAALAPLGFAPMLALEGLHGPIAPFMRSFERAARRGPRANAQLGVQVGLAFAVPHVVVGLLIYVLSLDSDPVDSVVIAGPIAAWVGVPRALATLAAVYVETDEAEASSARAGEASRLHGLAWLVAPALFVLAATFGAASLSPLPMRSGDTDPPVRGLDASMLSATPRSGRLPGTSVTVRATARGVVVEAEGGGGAGELEAGFDTTQSALRLDQLMRDGVPIDEYRITVRGDLREAYAIVDAEGTRLDDSVADRTLGRLGRFGSGALGLGMLLLLYMSFTVGIELGAARTMNAPALLGGPDRRRHALAALEGTLRIAEGSRVVYTPPRGLKTLLGRGSGDLRVEGEAWIEADGGAIRFRLPDGCAEVLGAVDGDAWDRKHVVLLSTFTSSGVAGLRTAAAPWPRDGRLTLGTRADARDVLVRRAVERASRVALPMLVSFGIACAAIWVEL